MKNLNTIENEGITYYEIPNLDGYYISKNGEVFSGKRNKKLVPNLSAHKYYYVDIFHNRKRKKMYVSRLMGITFLGLEVDENLNGKNNNLTMNHINENKLDNRLENLEVVSYRDNKRHSSINKNGRTGVVKYITGGNVKYRAEINIKGEKINIGSFETIDEAGDAYVIAADNDFRYDGDKEEFRNYVKHLMEIDNIISTTMEYKPF